MAFADLLFFGTLAVVVIVSSVILIGQFLRGDLAERRRVDVSPTPLHPSAPVGRHRYRAA